MAILDFQVWLDDAAETLFQADFDAYCSFVSVPFTLITQATTVTIDTRDGLRRGFDCYVEMFRAQKVTHMVRRASNVVELGPDLLCGNYETHLLRDAIRVVPAFASSTVLRREGGTWRAAVITNSWTNAKWPVVLPRITDRPAGGETEHSGLGREETTE